MLFNLFIKMKKVVLFFAVCASFALASCGNSNNASDAATDSTAVDSSAIVDSAAATVDTAAAAVDSAATDSAAK